MNTYYIKPVLSALMVIASAGVACPQEQGDTVTTMLKGVTVTGANQKMDAVSATYYPASKVKRASQNAIDLLRRMAISQILVDPVSNEVTTSSRESVAIYINSIPAGQAEISGLRTTDVRKVEYLDYPSDPRFQGHPHVINITVQQYLYGGYTKISDAQEAVNRCGNTGSVFSKFSYRRMTYDLYAGADYLNSSHSGISSDATFRLDGGTVRRLERLKDSGNESLRIPVTFRASYARKNLSVVNMIGFTFGDTYRNSREGELVTDGPQGSLTSGYRISAPSVSRSLSWTGNYYFIFRKGWSLYLIPTFAYTHTNASSSYHAESVPGDRIVNDSRENAWNAALNANVYKTVNATNSLTFHINAGTTRNEVAYLGSSPASTDLRHEVFAAAVQYTNNHRNRFVTNLNVGVTGDIYDTNGTDYTRFDPTASVTLTYMVNSRNQLQLAAGYSQYPLGGVFRNPNVIQTNEYLYQTGDPGLHNFGNLSGSLSYLFFAGNSLTFQAFSRYYGCYDRAVNTYTLNDGGDAVIQGPRNSGDFNRFSAGVNLTGRLFSSRLTLQASPSFTHSSSTGFHHLHRNHFSCSASAQYYFGNFNLTASWNSRDYTMGIITGEITRNAPYYAFQLGWGNGDWALSLEANNIFRYKYDSQWDTLVTPCYDNVKTIENASYHAGVRLSATYTFGYGKKVNRGNEVGATYGVGSAALKSGNE